MRKKLIEVSLPLDAINKESAREKSIRHGHPSTLHLWWARRPLAACRAVLFSSLVDDPSEYMPDEASAGAERERLFRLIEDMVKWENINNEEVLDKARLEIARSVARDLGVDVPVGKAAIRKFLAEQAPPVLDPFAGGGSIPLEAQRLGLRAYASDLNPVAVLINKALIEIPPKFAGMPPVHPPEDLTTNDMNNSNRRNRTKKKGGKQGELWQREWKGAEGLAEDVRYYGKWMRDEAEKRIGHLYPKYKITAELLAEREDLRAQGLKPGDELTVIAWLWARTVKCPNPACGAEMPLIRSFTLSTKKSNPTRLEPSVNKSTAPASIKYTIKHGEVSPSEGTVNRRGARCLLCNIPVPFEYIRQQGQVGDLDAQLMAVVAAGRGGRIYLPAIEDHVLLAAEAKPSWKPEADLSHNPRDFKTPKYGLRTIGDLFTPRQLAAMNTFSQLAKEVRQIVIRDSQNSVHLNDGTYADAVAVYLSLGVSKLADTMTSLVRWKPSMDQAIATFGRQALPMVWDYAESNTFNGAAGDFSTTINNLARVIENLREPILGIVQQRNASEISGCNPFLISTDPPYYDNIDYADLSDFFYIWLRKSLGEILPDLFSTVLVPKFEELIAAPHRFNGNRKQAEAFFENGLRNVFTRFNNIIHSSYPLTVFYAFKQTETEEEVESDEKSTVSIISSAVSTGWETMLEGLLSSKFQITGTWPVRTELSNRTLASEKNALASSIVLVCRPRPEDTPTATRREFLSALKRELPPALHQLQQGNIAPVDLAQAAIGPGMAIFSRYRQVLEADGSPMRVRAALALINQALDEYLAEQEGEYDSDTRWALSWFEQYGHEAGPYGVAETLSKAKNTSVVGLTHAGFLEARAGKVRLLRRDELEAGWTPEKDKRLTAWDAVQHLIRTLDKDGEAGAGALLAKLGDVGAGALSESARDLAYRLYTICERKGWAQEALAYNMLVVAWPRLKEQAGKVARQERLL